MTHFNIFIRSRHVFVDGMADLDRRLTKVEEVVFGPKLIEGNVYASRLSTQTNAQTHHLSSVLAVILNNSVVQP